MAFVRILLIYMLAVMVGGVLVSIANTHVGLQALAGVGAEIPASVRLDAIQRDLMGFAPTLTILLAIAFAVALPVSALVYRLLGRGWRRAGYTVGGAVAVIVLLNAITIFYGAALDATVTPIASARDWSGVLTLAIGGAAAGFLFALLTPEPQA